MAAKNGRKTTFGKTRQLTLGIPWRSKILMKSLYLAPCLRYIYTFLFSAKIQDGRHKLGKIEILLFSTRHHCTTHWAKNSLEIALSLTVSEIFTLFLFFAKIQNGRQKFRKLKFFVFTQDNLLLPFGSRICSNSLYL